MQLEIDLGETDQIIIIGIETSIEPRRKGKRVVNFINIERENLKKVLEILQGEL